MNRFLYIVAVSLLIILGIFYIVAREISPPLAKDLENELNKRKIEFTTYGGQIPNGAKTEDVIAALENKSYATGFVSPQHDTNAAGDIISFSPVFEVNYDSASGRFSVKSRLK